MEHVKTTPLVDTHQALGAKMVDYAGFFMPLEYTSIASEHHFVRKEAGLFDVSHMGEVFVEGKEATAFMEKLYTNDAVAMGEGKVTYGFMCNEAGGIIDDMLVYKYHPEKYFIVFNASNIEKDVNHMKDIASAFDVTIKDICDETGEVALQGPLSHTVLQELVSVDLTTIPFMAFFETTIHDIPCIISRTGYTGEDGFEIYTSAKNIKEIWEIILKNPNVHPCGLGCRDTLRFEASLPLYGQEIDLDISPLEAGLGFGVKFTHDFLGSEALKKQKEEGLKRKSMGLELTERGIPRHGYKVYVDKKEIGYITTGYMAPTVQKPIAMALVDATYAKIGQEVEVEIRNKMIKAVLRDKKFYQKTYVR